MEQAASRTQQRQSQPFGSTTRITDSSTFLITALDVGTPAVRPGVAAQLEQERTVLLIAAKAVLAAAKVGAVELGPRHFAVLDTAVRVAEAGA